MKLEAGSLIGDSSDKAYLVCDGESAEGKDENCDWTEFTLRKTDDGTVLLSCARCGEDFQLEVAIEVFNGEVVG